MMPMQVPFGAFSERLVPLHVESLPTGMSKMLQQQALQLSSVHQQAGAPCLAWRNSSSYRLAADAVCLSAVWLTQCVACLQVR